jgi:hypothetical protein
MIARSPKIIEKSKIYQKLDLVSDRKKKPRVANTDLTYPFK